MWPAGEHAGAGDVPRSARDAPATGGGRAVAALRGTRALAGAIKQAGEDVEAMGEQEIVEGAVRVAASEAAAERSAQLSAASGDLAVKGVGEVATAAAVGQVAKGAGNPA